MQRALTIPRIVRSASVSLPFKFPLPTGMPTPHVPVIMPKLALPPISVPEPKTPKLLKPISKPRVAAKAQLKGLPERKPAKVASAPPVATTSTMMRRRANTSIFGHQFYLSPAAFLFSPYFFGGRYFSTGSGGSHPPSDGTDKPSKSEVLSAIETVKFNKVTRRATVPSILELGLLARFGGKGGAGDALARSDPTSKDTAEFFNTTSQDYVHIGKGQDSERFYTGVFKRGAKTTDDLPHTVVMHLPEEVRATLEPDPHDTQGGRYRTPADISRQHILPRDLWIRPPGDIGADYAPFPAIDAIRGALPDKSQSRSFTQVTEDIREAQHGGRIYGQLP